jgi:hypothetical protein
MPFKANAERHHHIPKQKGNVTNWAAYNASLRQPAIASSPNHSVKLPRWRKLHIGVDANTGEIIATTLTTKDVDDASQVGALLEQVEGPVASFTADGAFDQDSVYDAVSERNTEAAVIVPPRSTAALSDGGDGADVA